MVLNAVKKLVGLDKKLYVLALSSKTVNYTDEVVEKIMKKQLIGFRH